MTITAKRPDELVETLRADFLTRDAWQSWTPTITQGVGVNVTVTFARYVVLADTVHVEAVLTCVGAGTLGQPIRIAGIPAAIRPTNTPSNLHVVGVGMVLDLGTAFYVGGLVVVGANDLRIIAHNLTSYVGSTPSFGLAGTDIIGFCATWER